MELEGVRAGVVQRWWEPRCWSRKSPNEPLWADVFITAWSLESEWCSRAKGTVMSTTAKGGPSSRHSSEPPESVR